jgi:hypothetical protein
MWPLAFLISPSSWVVIRTAFLANAVAMLDLPSSGFIANRGHLIRPPATFSPSDAEKEYIYWT